MKNPIKRIVALFVMILGAAALALTLRPSSEHSQITDAYQRASRVQHGSEAAEEAVRELALFEGKRVTQLLLRIALGQAEFSNEHIASEAVKALNRRGDIEVVDDLASLLRPEKSITTRLAAANALDSMGCPRRCGERVILYLKRLDDGELNIEDESIRTYERSGVLQQSGDPLVSAIRESQETLYSSLERVLSRAPSQTAAVLDQEYGLYSELPSLFALRLVGRLRLETACPGLLKSAQLYGDQGDSSIAKARQEAIGKAGCESARGASLP